MRRISRMHLVELIMVDFCSCSILSEMLLLATPAAERRATDSSCVCQSPSYATTNPTQLPSGWCILEYYLMWYCFLFGEMLRSFSLSLNQCVVDVFTCTRLQSVNQVYCTEPYHTRTRNLTNKNKREKSHT